VGVDPVIETLTPNNVAADLWARWTSISSCSKVYVTGFSTRRWGGRGRGDVDHGGPGVGPHRAPARPHLGPEHGAFGRKVALVKTIGSAVNFGAKSLANRA
jgi:hypothetical protein